MPTDMFNRRMRMFRAANELGDIVRELEADTTLPPGRLNAAAELHKRLNECAPFADEALGLPAGTVILFGGGGEKE